MKLIKIVTFCLIASFLCMCKNNADTATEENLGMQENTKITAQKKKANNAKGAKKRTQNDGKYSKYKKISNKKLGKYHLDEITKINRNFDTKIRAAKDVKLKQAFKKEKELALKRFLGDKLYQEYKAKIASKR